MERREPPTAPLRSRISRPARLACLIGAVAGLLLPACAGEPTAVMRLQAAHEALSAADEARDEGRDETALASYKHALSLYSALSGEYPGLEPGVVGFRIAYCDNQIDALLQRVTGQAAATPEETGAAHAAALPPPVPHAALLRAKDLLRRAENEEARATLLEALRADPDHLGLRLLTGIVQCRMGNFADATHVLTALVEEYPSDATFRVVLAACHFGEGRTEEAVLEIRRALDLDPSLSEAHYNLAQILLTLDPPERETARRHYRTALDLGAPPDWRLETLLGEQSEAAQ